MQISEILPNFFSFFIKLVNNNKGLNRLYNVRCSNFHLDIPKLTRDSSKNGMSISPFKKFSRLRVISKSIEVMIVHGSYWKLLWGIPYNNVCTKIFNNSPSIFCLFERQLTYTYFIFRHLSWTVQVLTYSGYWRGQLQFGVVPMTTRSLILTPTSLRWIHGCSVLPCLCLKILRWLHVI